MTRTDISGEPKGEILCKACGLCCTGHFFSLTGLQPDEITNSRSLGLPVEEPGSMNFYQPCPLWHGKCTIYSHPHKPQTCSRYVCKLLKEFQDEQISLTQALAVVHQTKEMICELELILPVRKNGNFRERLFQSINLLEQTGTHGGPETGATLLKAGVLLVYYSRRFGVIDLFNRAGMISEK